MNYDQHQNRKENRNMKHSVIGNGRLKQHALALCLLGTTFGIYATGAAPPEIANIFPDFATDYPSLTPHVILINVPSPAGWGRNARHPEPRCMSSDLACAGRGKPLSSPSRTRNIPIS